MNYANELRRGLASCVNCHRLLNYSCCISCNISYWVIDTPQEVAVSKNFGKRKYFQAYLPSDFKNMYPAKEIYGKIEHQFSGTRKIQLYSNIKLSDAMKKTEEELGKRLSKLQLLEE